MSRTPSLGADCPIDVDKLVEAHLSRLAAKQLVVEVTRGRVQASATLFEDA